MSPFLSALLCLPDLLLSMLLEACRRRGDIFFEPIKPMFCADELTEQLLHFADVNIVVLRLGLQPPYEDVKGSWALNIYRRLFSTAFKREPHCPGYMSHNVARRSSAIRPVLISPGSIACTAGGCDADLETREDSERRRLSRDVLNRPTK